MRLADAPEGVDLDVPATHFRCVEEDNLYDLENEGYDIENEPVESLDDVHCPNEEEGEDHPVELVHVSETPLLSPDAEKPDGRVNKYDNLSDFDADNYHHGLRVFSYTLVAS